MRQKEQIDREEKSRRLEEKIRQEEEAEKKRRDIELGLALDDNEMPNSPMS